MRKDKRENVLVECLREGFDLLAGEFRELGVEAQFTVDEMGNGFS